MARADHRGRLKRKLAIENKLGAEKCLLERNAMPDNGAHAAIDGQEESCNL